MPVVICGPCVIVFLVRYSECHANRARYSFTRFSDPTFRSTIGLRSYKKHAGRLVGGGPVASRRELLYLYNARRFPNALAGREDGRRFDLRPVEAHDEIDRVVRPGQRVALLVGAGTVFIDASLPARRAG